MQEIISKSNPLVISDSKLLDKKARDESGLYIVEGVKMLFDALTTNQRLVRIYFEKSVSEKQFELIKSLEQKGAAVIITSSAVISKLTDAKTPQGVVSVLAKNEQRPNFGNKVLLLENIQDPKNVGSLIRSACAAGFFDVCLVGSADAYSLKAVRASMSGLFFVNIHDETLSHAVELLSDYEIVVGDMAGEDVFSIDKFGDKLCVAVGNEGNGISDMLRRSATKVVGIPMECGIESLNVSIAGSLLMYASKIKR